MAILPGTISNYTSLDVKAYTLNVLGKLPGLVAYLVYTPGTIDFDNVWTT